MKNILYVFLLHTVLCYSQNIIIVTDSITKEPLPYALITFDDSNGVYSNEKGVFTVNSDISAIEVQYLGYKTKKVSSSSLKDTIKLHPVPEVLKELIVSTKKEKKKINSLKRPSFFGDCILKPESEVISTILPNLEIKDLIIDKVTFSFKKLEWAKNKEILKNELAIIRINIYDLKDNIPNKLLFSSKPIKINAYEKETLTVNLENELITMEENGLAFAIEYIGNINNKGDFYKTSSLYLRPELAENKSKYYKGTLLQKFQLKGNKNDIIDLIAHWNKTFDKNNKISERVLNISLELTK